MKKVLLTATVQSHIAQFHLPLIDMLQKEGFEVHVAAKDNLFEKNGLKLTSPNKIYDISFHRSPFRFENRMAYKQLKQIISENNYSIIHCNTPVGGILTRMAARKLRESGTQVYYTAHGFHFYKGASPINWLIYFPVEKFFAKYTDKIFTISKEDYVLAKVKKFKTKVERIHGVGADTSKYFPISPEENLEIRKKEGFKQEDFICICVGELNSNKNQITLIKAVKDIINWIPNFKLLLAGNGPKREELEKYIRDNELNSFVNLIGYRNDLDKFIKISNVVVSASIREGLGLNIIEAMLCEKPIIASKNRGHNELIRNGENGILVNAKKSNEFAKAIVTVHQNDLSSNFAKKSLIYSEKYTKESVVSELKLGYRL